MLYFCHASLPSTQSGTSAADGATVGDFVGDAEGLAVGLLVGEIEGRAVGRLVGDADGDSLVHAVDVQHSHASKPHPECFATPASSSSFVQRRPPQSWQISNASAYVFSWLHELGAPGESPEEPSCLQQRTPSFLPAEFDCTLCRAVLYRHSLSLSPLSCVFQSGLPTTTQYH